MLFEIMTEDDELKIEEKRPADASAVNCNSVITFSPILSLLGE
jgi:hypothetical protein